MLIKQGPDGLKPIETAVCCNNLEAIDLLLLKGARWGLKLVNQNIFITLCFLSIFNLAERCHYTKSEFNC